VAAGGGCEPTKGGAISLAGLPHSRRRRREVGDPHTVCVELLGARVDTNTVGKGLSELYPVPSLLLGHMPPFGYKILHYLAYISIAYRKVGH
jgi:hypothetical protein